ncbi:helix-hairpin-helix domain-containing protein [Microbacterium sp. R86528]|uniref:helix-hairpin-helix domain-containing protein n=1 Tax=Microbacterium sp. R86528 TaxID=3093864 RepID=UPI0037C74757
MSATKDQPPSSPRQRLGLGAAIVIVIVALAVTVGIGVVRSTVQPSEEVIITDATGTSSIENEVIYVHVSGAVTAPGLYVLDQGARVVDAITAAGGFDDEAAPSALNLARLLSDGEQLVAPTTADLEKTPGASNAAAGGAQTSSDGRVNLNSSDLAQLDTLPGIGPALAQRIIEWRETNGNFTSVEDLLAVSGIGEKMLATLRDLVVV